MSLKTAFQNIILDKELMEKVKFLGGLNIFEGLNYRSLAKIYQAMQVKTYHPGDIIFNEGEIGRAIFIIKKGEVELSKQGKPLAVIKDGDFFGEMALLEEIPRTAAAKSLAESEIGFIYKVRFDSLVGDDPRLGLMVIQNLARMLSHRLRRMSDQYVKGV
jgi:CRP-like cAMP-binding protein